LSGAAQDVDGDGAFRVVEGQRAEGALRGLPVQKVGKELGFLLADTIRTFAAYPAEVLARIMSPLWAKKHALPSVS